MGFETEVLHFSHNFSPGDSLAWIAFEYEAQSEWRACPSLRSRERFRIVVRFRLRLRAHSSSVSPADAETSP